MAEVDRSPQPWRAIVDVLWWAEQRAAGVLHARAARVEARGDYDGDPYDLNPPVVDWAAGWLYGQRKAAERRALARMTGTPMSAITSTVLADMLHRYDNSMTMPRQCSARLAFVEAWRKAPALSRLRFVARMVWRVW